MLATEQAERDSAEPGLDQAERDADVALRRELADDNGWINRERADCERRDRVSHVLGHRTPRMIPDENVFFFAAECDREAERWADDGTVSSIYRGVAIRLRAIAGGHPYPRQC